MKKYAGVVVLYQPLDQVYENIKTYIDSIEKLYVIDNSIHVNKELIEAIKTHEKCVYKKLEGNEGLAKALNVGCEYALEAGFDYILTMDQDSYFAVNAVEKMKQKVELGDAHYSIVAPNVVSIYQDIDTNEWKTAYRILEEKEEKLHNWVMTSGSLMSLQDYKAVGGFDDSLFIAHIDIDLGLNMYKKDMKILMLGQAVIYQRFGNSRPKKILWKTVHPWYENSVRTYYLFRNQTYLIRKHGKKYKDIIHISLWKHLVKVLLFEDKKLEKMKMARKGYQEGKQGKMGEYRN